MKIKYFIILIILFAIVCNPSNGQTLAIPQLTYKSPKAAELQRFIDHPVDMFHGLVNVSVPIHTISVNGIEVPIEFKYHTGGMKYNSSTHELGLGWTVMAGGMISVTINGIPDSDVGGSRFAKPVNALDIRAINGGSTTDHKSLRDILKSKNNDPGLWFHERLDSEQDIFHYTMPTRSGKFVLDDGIPVTIPYVPIKIPYPSGNIITIVDENGINYYFKQYMVGNDHQNMRAEKEFYLERIVSADKKDEVKFNYTQIAPSNANLGRIYRDDYHTFSLTTTLGFHPFYSSQHYQSGSYQWRYYYPPVLNSIEYRGGKVEFERENMWLVKKIKIYTGQDILPIKTIEVIHGEYSNVRNSKKDKRLDEVRFYGQNNLFLYDYKLKYYGDPVWAGLDYWGYVNGKSGRDYLPNIVTVSRQDSQYGTGIVIQGGMDRTPDPYYAQQGTLKEIHYPTKGYSRFSYEGNKAVFATMKVDYGGLRIKQIENCSENGEVLERKIYSYANIGELEYGYEHEIQTGYGKANYYPSSDDFLTENIHFNLTDGNATTGERIDNITCSLFPNNNYYEAAGAGGAVYPCVTEYIGDASGKNGKNVYYFSYIPPERYYRTHIFNNPTGHCYRTSEWQNGELYTKISYDTAGNRTYMLSNTYQTLKYKEFLNLNVIGRVTANGPSQKVYMYLDDYNNPEYTSILPSDYSVYDLYNYYNTTGLRVLTKSVETMDGVTKTTTFNDFSDLGKPREEVGTTSNSDNIRKKYKYPADVFTGSFASNFPFKTAIIEQETYIGESFQKRMRTNYSQGANGNQDFYAPSFVEYLNKGQTVPEKRLVYHNYDLYGNPLYITKDDTEKVVYLWSYLDQYPIAEIKGVAYQDVSSVLSSVFGSGTTFDSLSKASVPNETKLKDGSLQKALPNALVTTYTYKPLAGMLTATDSSGITTYYEYNSFNRLKRTYIKEGTSEKNIQTYDYHYQNQ